ncbi:MAG: type II toxin-antitoxin system HipA family toxin [Elusimicrobia bacterium]|nr:type II toxin-antitoxin system HipA family toxin [Elusimicrobiota bacterium]
MGELLQVYWGTNLVGQLRLDNRENFVFQYALEWIDQTAIPLSIRLPLQEEPFPDSICRFFFTNLLPEGNVRILISRKLGISETNDFELLKALGGDCAGAISLLAEGEKFSDQGDYDLITSEELDSMILEMLSSPLLIWKENLRLSLAGAQQKLPVYLQDGKIYMPRGSYPSSHILKPNIPGFDNIIENEAFCMNLAKNIGLPVPKVSILKNKQPVYLVERYDRKKNEQNKLIRLHQEDFCQALGYSYARKYETEGGPDLKKCFSLISDFGTQPIIDKKILIQWVVFNVLIGNCDTHAKNISMLITKENYQIAPYYDLISTIVYPSLSSKLAMRIGGEDRVKWIFLQNWQALAQAAAVQDKAILKIVQEMSERLPNVAKQLAEEFCAKYECKKIVENICNHITTLSNKSIASLIH